MMPKTTARMLPTKTAKKSSTRDRPAPQPIQPLHVKRKGHQHADERQDVDVLAERRKALRDGNQAAFEADDVGQHEGRDAEHRIGTDV